METLTLETLCNIDAGGTPLRSKKEYWENGTIPWIKISDIDSKYIKCCEEKITKEGLNNSSAKLFPKGTILYTIFATIGEVGILEFEATTNQAIAGIRLKNEEIILNEYLYYYLISLKEKMKSESRGVAQNNINLSILRKTLIPIKTKDEQKKIISILSKLEKLIINKNNQILKLNELIKSQFVEMFDNSEYNKLKVSDVCESIIRGPFGSALKKEFFVEKGINTYKVYEQKNAINSDSTLGTYYIDENRFKELKRFECRPGDIIMSCSGTIGKLLILPESIEKGVINQALLKYRVDNNKVTSQYFIDYVKLNINKLETKGTGLQNLGSVSFIKDMLIPVPPIEEQIRYEKIVEQIDKQKFEFEKQLKKLEELQDALMQEYFG